MKNNLNITHVKSISRWAGKYLSEYHCNNCDGSRLNKESTSYKIGKESIKDLTTMNLSKFYNWLKTIKIKLDKNQTKDFFTNFKGTREKNQFYFRCRTRISNFK